MQKTDEAVRPDVVAKAACHEPFVEAWEGLGESADHALLDVLRSGTEKHRELEEELRRLDDAGGDRTVVREQIAEYRRVVATDLLEPLARAFEHRGPSSAIATHLREAARTSAALCAELPESLSTPWPENALARKPSDRFRRRLGKALARLVSSARRAGRERPLPLRQTAYRHLAEFVLPGQDEAGSRAIQSWAGWSRRLELVWVEWGRTALPALVQAELDDDDTEDEAAGEEAAAVGATLLSAAKTLQEGLELLLVEDPRTVPVTEALQQLNDSGAALEADLAVAGSFLLRPDGPAPEPRLPRTSELAQTGDAWDESISARMGMYHSLLAILSGSTAVQERTAARFRKRCLADVATLTDAATRLSKLEADLEAGWESNGLRSRLERLDDDVEESLQSALRALPEPALVDTALTEISDASVEALLAMIRQTPTALVLHSIDAKPSKGLKAETRTVALQELARQSFDALRIERIRSSTEGLVDAVETVRGEISELRDVYTFARDEALRELDTDDDDARARALDLLGGALRSIAEALTAHRSGLEGALADALNRLTAEIAEGSTALLERVGAGRMEARLFAARSRAAALRAWITERWGPPLQRASRWAMLRFVRLRRLSERVLRKGSAMVGSAPAETAASSRTLKALASTEELKARLPLVYQRLFTFEPVSDRALMAGRDAQLSEGLRRWRRWHDADGVPLIVRARQGNGITSFLNVLGAEIEADGGSVVRHALDDRVTDGATLARRLATALGLPEPDSLDELTRSIFDTLPSDLPAAVALDNLEHLYLRAPHGTDLIERLLTLMSETEPRVFWIGGISASAWQLVATHEPTACAQVDVLDLPPLTPDEIHEAIIVRHRRSGLAIHFEEPKSGRHLLRRRLRRMRDQKGYQRLLEEDFFDTLHRASGGYLRLALWQWLMAADFEAGDGVRMRQPQRPDFAILDALDLTQSFTVKAFLEHRSLTLEEHDRIFRLPRHESYQIFESLRNRHILEPLASDPATLDARSEIEEDLRYRVRPLLRGALLSHLQARNIVH